MSWAMAELIAAAQWMLENSEETDLIVVDPGALRRSSALA
ncbi:hypothetical protein SRABI26_03703 [Arthrobacter sp. Bi26]|nr:hypothetical protein SRABI26_03703 [Arthrobacter sp. Bi26]